MTKEQLMKYISFNNDAEKEDVSFYIDVKGIALHIKVMQYLKFDFKDGTTKSWVEVSAVLKRDKLIRDKLYIYLATLEEYFRAYISNTYEDDVSQSFWINGRFKNDKIKQKLGNGEKLSDILQKVSFGTLIEQVQCLPDSDKDAMFDQSVTKNNLDAVRDLRNAVSHHEFLFARNFLPCEVGGCSDSTLIHNIKNLKYLLPQRYRCGTNGKGGITAEMAICGISI